MTTAIEHLTSQGIHSSQQRIAIMDFLLKNRTHPTADEIFTALSPTMPTLSKTTVYNTLKLFEDQGAVMAISIDEKNLRYDAYTAPHAHFRCRSCGRIHDLPISQTEVSNHDGFSIESTHIYHWGLCPSCLAKPNNDNL